MPQMIGLAKAAGGMLSPRFRPVPGSSVCPLSREYRPFHALSPTPGVGYSRGVLVLDQAQAQADQGDGVPQQGHTLAVSLGSPMQTVELVPQHRVQSLISIGFQAFAHHMPVVGQPLIYPVAIADIPLGLGQPVVQLGRWLRCGLPPQSPPSADRPLPPLPPSRPTPPAAALPAASPHSSTSHPGI